jgi:hypothetical protein
MQTDKRISRPVSSLSLRLWSEAAVLALIAMELTWITVWYELTARPLSGLGTTILILGLALIGSYGVGRVMNALHVRLDVRRSIFLAWLVFYVFFSLRIMFLPLTGPALSDLFRPIWVIFAGQWEAREFWHVLVICLLGLRGVSLATMAVEQPRVLASLQLGLLMFLLYGLSNPVGTAVVFFIFLAFGMISLSAAGIAGISTLRGGRMPHLNWSWTAGILASALLAAGIAVLAGWLLSSKEVSTLLGQIVLGGMTVLLTLIGLALSPLMLLFFWIITSISHLISGLIDPKVLESFRQSLDLMNSAGQGQAGKIINTTAARNLILGGAIVAVIWITLGIIKRQPRKRRLAEEEDSPGAGANRRVYPSGKIKKDRPGWLNPERLMAAALVRRIYAQLMDLCEKLGYARPVAVTPLEFLPTLRQIFPEGESQVSLITNAYLRVRYGELSETAAEVEDIRQAWRWLRARSRILLVENKNRRKKR